MATRDGVRFLLPGIALLLAVPGVAQIAAPGDVYYQVHVDQKFQYYVFAGDVLTWEDTDFAGTSLATAVAHDTTTVQGSLGVSIDLAAEAGTFLADTGTSIAVAARTGIFHILTNTLTVSVYVKGPTGTPYWMTKSAAGQALASRWNGTPGSLQPVNGTSSSTFMDSTAATSVTGEVIVPVDVSEVLSGTTTTTLVVGADTYSLARTFTFPGPAEVTQALCILGCMRSAADFLAQAGGHIEIHTYPYADPTDAPRVAAVTGPVSVQVSPNPARGDAAVSFRAPAGQRATLRAFDVRGRMLGILFDGPASGGLQRVSWQPLRLPAGTYFVRVQTPRQSATGRITILR